MKERLRQVPAENQADLFDWHEIRSDETSFAEATKYEILGLRGEMMQYMNQTFQVENYTLSAAAVTFAFTFSLDPNPNGQISKEVVATIVALTLVAMSILYFGYERMKKLRYRITRLGLFIYFREDLFRDRHGWEHFVFLFREIDMQKMAERVKSEINSAQSWEQRAKRLNGLVEEIDKFPGIFTSNSYGRWNIILGAGATICIARLFWATSYLVN